MSRDVFNVQAPVKKEKLDDKMDSILKPQDKTVAVFKKPSSANRKFTTADVEGEDRAGLIRDSQKA